MTTVPFDPTQDLILLEVDLHGPRRAKQCLFVLDTGCAVTLVRPEVLDEIGYSARDGEARTTITSALGRESGYTLRIARFDALGFTRRDVLFHVHDLPDEAGVDGLLGLSFLSQFNYEIRSQEGRILVSPV